MKKVFIMLLIGVLITGSVFAQRTERRSAQERGARQNRQSENNITVEGTIKLSNGFVAVESGDNVYIVPMLNRFIGFIYELKEGAAVKIEGTSFRNMISPVKVTIAGKSYDFNNRNQEMRNFNTRDFNRREFNKKGFNHNNFNRDRGLNRKSCNCNCG